VTPALIVLELHRLPGSERAVCELLEPLDAGAVSVSFSPLAQDGAPGLLDGAVVGVAHDR
jgi:hypothetical protein